MTLSKLTGLFQDFIVVLVGLCSFLQVFLLKVKAKFPLLFRSKHQRSERTLWPLLSNECLTKKWVFNQATKQNDHKQSF